jgi:hypothetical protein
VIVACDLVEPELNIGDFGGDGIDCGKRPAGEIANGLCRIDALGASGLVDGQGIIPMP